MSEKKFSWNMCYQVCQGGKNFGIENAKKVAAVTGTDTLTWIDPERAGARKQFFKTIVDRFGLTRTKQQPHKRGGKK